MTVLFAGGEDSSFSLNYGSGPVDAYSTDTASGNFRPLWARGAIGFLSANSWRTPPYGAQANVWMHAYTSYIQPSGSSVPVMSLFDAGGVQRLAVRLSGPNGNLILSKRNAAGTWTDLATATLNFPSRTLQALDWQVNYAVAGSSKVYVQGVLHITYTGDVTTDGVTAVAQSAFHGVSDGFVDYNWWSEFLVQDSDTRGSGVLTIAGTGDGNSHSMTGNYTMYTEFKNDDTTYAASNLPTALQQVATGAVIPSGNWIVAAWCQEARVTRGLTGPQTFLWNVRSTGNVDNNSATPIAADLYFFDYFRVMPQNPFTSAAWAVGDFGAGFQYGVKSNT
jgi:hypothetical protein